MILKKLISSFYHFGQIFPNRLPITFCNKPSNCTILFKKILKPIFFFFLHKTKKSDNFKIYGYRLLFLKVSTKLTFYIGKIMNIGRMKYDIGNFIITELNFI